MVSGALNLTILQMSFKFTSGPRLRRVLCFRLDEKISSLPSNYSFNPTSSIKPSMITSFR